MTKGRTFDPWVRKPVEDFAQEMERVLRTHDDEKIGWEGMSPDKILNKIIEEYDELKGAYQHTVLYRDQAASIRKETSWRCFGEEMRRQSLMHECVDLANACMMMWDNLGKGRRDLEAAERLKGDGDHEFRDIQHEDFDNECVFCGVRIDSSCGIAGAMMPCHEEQRLSKRKTKADPGNK